VGTTFSHFVTNHAYDRQTDGQTDGQTDSSLAARLRRMQCMQRCKNQIWIAQVRCKPTHIVQLLRQEQEIVIYCINEFSADSVNSCFPFTSSAVAERPRCRVGQFCPANLSNSVK